MGEEGLFVVHRMQKMKQRKEPQFPHAGLVFTCQINLLATALHGH